MAERKPPAPQPRWYNTNDYRVEEIESNIYGDPSIASGSFGTVHIALCQEQQHVDRSGRCWKYAAVKTIRNAVFPSSIGGGCNSGPMSMASSWGFAGAVEETPVEEEGGIREQAKLTREVFAELAALRALSGKHPCIVPLLAAYPSRTGLGCGSGLSLVFPYCPIDLSSAIQHRRYNAKEGMISDSVVKAIFRDILSALKHCHDHGVVHGDVNPANFMVSTVGRVQLTDFGLATACPSLVPGCRDDDVSNNKKLPTHAMCAINYRAPEIMLGETIANPSMDIWGAGLILCELLTLRTTFMGRNDIDQLNRIFDVLGTPSDSNWSAAKLLPDFGKIRFDPREPQDLANIVPRAAICNDLCNIINVTVTLDPKQRVAASTCLTDMARFLSKPLPVHSYDVLLALVPKELLVSPVVIHETNNLGADGNGVVDLAGDKKRAISVAVARRSKSKQTKVGGHYDCDGQGIGIGDSAKSRCRVQANGLLNLLACCENEETTKKGRGV